MLVTSAFLSNLPCKGYVLVIYAPALQDDSRGAKELLTRCLRSLNVHANSSTFVRMHSLKENSSEGTKERPLRVFISYSRKDVQFRETLQTHLKPLVRERTIEIWHDQMLTPGSVWEEHLHKKLQSSDVMLFLISPDFIDSDFIAEKEIPIAVARAESGQATLIPILIRSSDYKGHTLGRYTLLPPNGEPVTRWPDADMAWREIKWGLDRAIKDHRERITNAITNQQQSEAGGRQASVHLIAAPEDTVELSQIEKHLNPFVKNGLFSLSDVRMLNSFGNRAEIWNSALASADLVVLLVTAELLNSDFYEGTLRTLLARQEADDVIILPILVRSCDWEATELRKLDSFVPWNRHFLAEHSDIDAAFRETARMIAAIVYKVIYKA